MRKGALLVHGWATDPHVWHRFWMMENDMPIRDMLTANGYEVVIIDLPGRYLQREKDLDWYSRYLGHIIREREELQEIAIIGHSMGGLAGRHYLTLSDEIFQEGIDRVRFLFSLGTPNHGTSVPLFDVVSKFLTTIADLVAPADMELGKGEENNYFLTTPCYRDVQLGSPFLAELNSRKLPAHVEHHVIWTNGDTVADPQHTCVLEGASNHLIDRLAVNHFNMGYRQEVVREVERILQGRSVPRGLQDHPPVEGCTVQVRHRWLPGNGLVSRDGLNVWRCSICSETTICHTIPTALRCGIDSGRSPLHRWERLGRFYRYKFTCSGCGKTVWYPEMPESVEERSCGRILL